jgi:hypothetical protein
MEASKSPDIIFQHYRELVMAETATGWFCVTPALVDVEKEALKTEGAKRKAEREKADAEKAGGAEKRGVRRRPPRRPRRRGWGRSLQWRLRRGEAGGHHPPASI